MKTSLKQFAENYDCELSLLRNLATVVMASFDSNGCIIEANQGFAHLLNMHKKDLTGLCVREKFINPGFDTFISLNSLQETTVYEGILTIGDFLENNRSVVGAVHRLGKDFLLLAEHDLKSLEQLNSTVISLNDELSTLHRDMARANRELKKKDQEKDQVLNELAEINIQLQSEVAKRRKTEEQLKYLASYDALTGVANRALLKTQLEKMLAAAQRNNDLLGILFIDVDNFKQINDKYGHNIGDAVLVELALTLQDSVRQSDLVGRWGGDEFIAVLPQYHSQQDIENVAQRILDQTSQPQEALNNEKVLISIGIALYPDQGQNAETLIDIADANMYKAKERGDKKYLANS